jgi:hypothetical protein
LNLTGSIKISYTASCNPSEDTKPDALSTSCFTTTEGTPSDPVVVIDHDKKTITKTTTIPVTVVID